MCLKLLLMFGLFGLIKNGKQVFQHLQTRLFIKLLCKADFIIFVFSCLICQQQKKFLQRNKFARITKFCVRNITQKNLQPKRLKIQYISLTKQICQNLSFEKQCLNTFSCWFVFCFSMLKSEKFVTR